MQSNLETKENVIPTEMRKVSKRKECWDQKLRNAGSHPKLADPRHKFFSREFGKINVLLFLTLIQGNLFCVSYYPELWEDRFLLFYAI